MKQIKLITLFLALLCLVSGYAQSNKFTSRVVSLDGEKWWGAMVALGHQMPYSDNIKLINLATENRNNQNVPLLLSSMGRYIWSDMPFKFKIVESEIIITSDYETLSPIDAGRTLRDAYLAASGGHMSPTGEIPDPLFFSMPQYNTWIELTINQNQSDILDYCSKLQEYNFPAGVFIIDDGWSKYYGNFDFKSDKFHDPKGMIQELHERGFKVMLWVSPFVSADSPEFRELNGKGFLIKSRTTKQAAIIPWWNGLSACYDLTNPDAVAHLVNKLKALQQSYNVDGYKFDAGDIAHYRSADLVYSKPNAASTDICQAWAKIGLEFSFNEYRAGWKMGGQPLVQRLGDKDYSWAALQMLIPGMVSAGLLGYAYTCPDMIGGGQINSFKDVDEASIDQALIVRSCQVHALMPMMQFSLAPWRILDEKHLNIVVKYAQLHEQFGNYILSCAQEASRSGEPIVRHMEYCYPNQGFLECKDQFMLGSKYLVAPMLTKGTTRSVALPQGVWRDDRGDEIIVKKGVYIFETEVPIDRLPYYELIQPNFKTN